jgi:hypothetical protein
VGLIAGGVASALLAWVLSGLVDWIPPGAAAYIAASAAVVAVLRDLRIVSIPLPERRELVPRSILHQAPHRAALGFGVELGLGFRTFVSASAPYLLLIVLLLHAESLATFLLAGAGFALGRFAMPLTRYFSADGDAWDGLMDERAGVVRSATAIVAALGVVVVLTAT